MNGEGFAFFRWHALRYPDMPPGGCKGSSSALCRIYWTAGTRR